MNRVQPRDDGFVIPCTRYRPKGYTYQLIRQIETADKRRILHKN